MNHQSRLHVFVATPMGGRGSGRAGSAPDGLGLPARPEPRPPPKRYENLKPALIAFTATAGAMPRLSRALASAPQFQAAAAEFHVLLAVAVLGDGQQPRLEGVVAEPALFADGDDAGEAE